VLRPPPTIVAVCVDCLSCAGRPLPPLDLAAAEELRECQACGGLRFGPYVVTMSVAALLYGGRQTLPAPTSCWIPAP
jgi:hypothetical protein